MAEPWVYLNGQLLPASTARLPIYDLAIVQGATVSEMTRTFRRRLYRLEDHVDRLFNSLACVGFDPGITKGELGAISEKLVERNARLVGEGGELALVHFVSAGEHSLYAGHAVRSGSTVCAHTFPLPFSTWTKKFREGVHLVTPAVRQVAPECIHPHIKYRSRLHYYLADKQAREVDCDAIALLLDANNHITETNGANFLMVERGAIVSPPFERTLRGVSRQTVFELADRLGIATIQRQLTLADALAADETFLTGTSYCMLPVVKINGHLIGAGRRGPLFDKLLHAWSDHVGLDIARQIAGG